MWKLFVVLFHLNVAVNSRVVGKLNPFLPENRIVGGTETDILYHPYQLSLQLHKSHTCGASIIGKKWAVTAGHCVASPASAYRLGSGNSKLKSIKSYHKISKIYRHPKYDSYAIDYDIALLKIHDEFKYDNTTREVNLPKIEIQPGAVVNITGWGATSQGSRLTNKLMRVQVPVINRETCREAYKFVKEVTDRMICAGQLKNGGKDACQGDSGGPLSTNGTLYGIVSWGYGCAAPYYPGVYTNVAYLRPWIANITGI